jgi:hypothetical protein
MTRTRIKNLPRQITKYNGKKETVLELQKQIRVNNYSIDIKNLLIKSI